MINQNFASRVRDLENEWNNNPRWQGIQRPYTAEQVVRLQGSSPVEHSLARSGADKLWRLLHENAYINALGAMTGLQGRRGSQRRSGACAAVPRGVPRVSGRR